MEVGFQTQKTECLFNTSNRGGKKSWQTIVKKIRVAVSRAVVNRLRAVKARDKRPAADKVSRADSKVARVDNRVANRVANKVAVKKVVSRATASPSAVSR